MTRVTRRSAAFALLAPAAAASQQTTPAAKPAENPDAELEAARQQLRRASDQMRKFKVPIATEPSFVFRP